MQLTKILISMLVVLSTPAFAEDCEQRDSMPEIRKCLIETTIAEMEQTYQSILTKLTTDEAKGALEESQEIFIEYRNQSCSAVWEASQQLGWVADDNTTNCVTRLTDERIRFLMSIPKLD